MDYVSVRVSTLRGDQKIDFNAYVKINEKMVLYLRQGDSFEGERLDRLKQKKLRKMYILTSEEPLYRRYLQQNIDMAYDTGSGKNINVRAEIIQGAQQANADEVFENPENVESYNNARDAAGKYVQFLMGNTQAVSAIMNIQNSDQSISHHGVTVATLAVALANRMGGIDSKKIQLMTLGALLHDYGHHDSALSLNRPLKSFSKEELALYLQHPQLGAQKIRDKKHFDQTVLHIISQHEEKVDGSGPLKLNESQQDPLAVIVATANALDRLITYEGVPKNDAPKRLMIQSVGAHPLMQIQHLAEVIKTTVT